MLLRCTRTSVRSFSLCSTIAAIPPISSVYKITIFHGGQSSIFRISRKILAVSRVARIEADIDLPCAVLVQHYAGPTVSHTLSVTAVSSLDALAGTAECILWLSISRPTAAVALLREAVAASDNIGKPPSSSQRQGLSLAKWIVNSGHNSSLPYEVNLQHSSALDSDRSERSGPTTLVTVYETLLAVACLFPACARGVDRSGTSANLANLATHIVTKLSAALRQGTALPQTPFLAAVSDAVVGAFARSVPARVGNVSCTQSNLELSTKCLVNVDSLVTMADRLVPDTDVITPAASRGLLGAYLPIATTRPIAVAAVSAALASVDRGSALLSVPLVLDPSACATSESLSSAQLVSLECASSSVRRLLAMEEPSAGKSNALAFVKAHISISHNRASAAAKHRVREIFGLIASANETDPFVSAVLARSKVKMTSLTALRAVGIKGYELPSEPLLSFCSSTAARQAGFVIAGLHLFPTAFSALQSSNFSTEQIYQDLLYINATACDLLYAAHLPLDSNLERSSFLPPSRQLSISLPFDYKFITAVFTGLSKESALNGVCRLLTRIIRFADPLDIARICATLVPSDRAQLAKALLHGVWPPSVNPVEPNPDTNSTMPSVAFCLPPPDVPGPPSPYLETFLMSGSTHYQTLPQILDSFGDNTESTIPRGIGAHTALLIALAEGRRPFEELCKVLQGVAGSGMVVDVVFIASLFYVFGHCAPSASTVVALLSRFLDISADLPEMPGVNSADATNALESLDLKVDELYCVQKVSTEISLTSASLFSCVITAVLNVGLAESVLSHIVAKCVRDVGPLTVLTRDLNTRAQNHIRGEEENLAVHLLWPSSRSLVNIASAPAFVSPSEIILTFVAALSGLLLPVFSTKKVLSAHRRFQPLPSALAPAPNHHTVTEGLKVRPLPPLTKGLVAKLLSDFTYNEACDTGCGGLYTASTSLGSLLNKACPGRASLIFLLSEHGYMDLLTNVGIETDSLPEHFHSRYRGARNVKPSSILQYLRKTIVDSLRLKEPVPPAAVDAYELAMKTLASEYSLALRYFELDQLEEEEESANEHALDLFIDRCVEVRTSLYHVFDLINELYELHCAQSGITCGSKEDPINFTQLEVFKAFGSQAGEYLSLALPPPPYMPPLPLEFVTTLTRSMLVHLIPLRVTEQSGMVMPVSLLHLLFLDFLPAKSSAKAAKIDAARVRLGHTSSFRANIAAAVPRMAAFRAILLAKNLFPTPWLTSVLGDAIIQLSFHERLVGNLDVGPPHEDVNVTVGAVSVSQRQIFPAILLNDAGLAAVIRHIVVIVDKMQCDAARVSPKGLFSSPKNSASGSLFFVVTQSSPQSELDHKDVLLAILKHFVVASQWEAVKSISSLARAISTGAHQDNSGDIPIHLLVACAAGSGAYLRNNSLNLVALRYLVEIGSPKNLQAVVGCSSMHMLGEVAKADRVLSWYRNDGVVLVPVTVLALIFRSLICESKFQEVVQYWCRYGLPAVSAALPAGRLGKIVSIVKKYLEKPSRVAPVHELAVVDILCFAFAAGGDFSDLCTSKYGSAKGPAGLITDVLVCAPLETAALTLLSLSNQCVAAAENHPPSTESTDGQRDQPSRSMEVVVDSLSLAFTVRTQQQRPIPTKLVAHVLMSLRCSSPETLDITLSNCANSKSLPLVRIGNSDEIMSLLSSVLSGSDILPSKSLDFFTNWLRYLCKISQPLAPAPMVLLRNCVGMEHTHLQWVVPESRFGNILSIPHDDAIHLGILLACTVRPAAAFEWMLNIFLGPPSQGVRSFPKRKEGRIGFDLAFVPAIRFVLAIVAAAFSSSRANIEVKTPHERDVETAWALFKAVDQGLITLNILSCICAPSLLEGDLEQIDQREYVSSERDVLRTAAFAAGTPNTLRPTGVILTALHWFFRAKALHLMVNTVIYAVQNGFLQETQLLLLIEAALEHRCQNLLADVLFFLGMAHPMNPRDPSFARIHVAAPAGAASRTVDRFTFAKQIWIASDLTLWDLPCGSAVDDSKRAVPIVLQSVGALSPPCLALSSIPNTVENHLRVDISIFDQDELRKLLALAGVELRNEVHASPDTSCAAEGSPPPVFDADAPPSSRG